MVFHARDRIDQISSRSIETKSLLTCASSHENWVSSEAAVVSRTGGGFCTIEDRTVENLGKPSLAQVAASDL